ncbi:unnamed protein product [Sympodiomycopsis kandeliae]
MIKQEEVEDSQTLTTKNHTSNADRVLTKAVKRDLLSLPPELLSHIATFLPLSSALIFRLQVCRSLRSAARLGSLRLPGIAPHTLSFAAWQQAADDFQSLGIESDVGPEPSDATGNDGQGSSSGNRQRPGVPALPDLRQQRADFPTWRRRHDDPNAPRPILVTQDDFQRRVRDMANAPPREARLFCRVLTFLGLMHKDSISASYVKPFRKEGKINTSLPEDLQPWKKTDGTYALDCVSFVSWHGMGGQHVVHFLQTISAMAGIRCLIKSDRFDHEVWQAYTPGELKTDPPTSAVEARNHSSRSEVPISPRKMPVQNRYTETQVVANVGSKASPNFPIKGRGLFAGYKAFCFGRQADSSLSEEDVDQVPFHIIFQGRFQVQEALETEQMLALSSLECKHCKRTLVLS